jgi:hypothetical protein
VRWSEGSRGVRSGKSLACPWARILLCRRWAGRPPAPARSRRRVRRQGGGAIGHGRQCARPMSRCLGHLVSSLPPPSNSAIGPALWARRGTVRPGPGVKLEPRRPPYPGVVPVADAGGRVRTSLTPGVCRAGWYFPPGEGIGRTRPGAGSRPRRGRSGPSSARLCPALPCRAGQPSTQNPASCRVPEVDDQLAALRRLPAAFGPIEVVEVISNDPGDDPAATQGELIEGKDGRPEADDS